LLQGAFLMLVHIGQGDIAERAHNAWLKTIEDGIHTYDIYKEGVSKQKVGTREFADAIIERMGQRPAHLHPASYAKDATMDISARPGLKPAEKKQVGVDIFVDRPGGNPDDIAAALQRLGIDGAKLTGISNRGTKVWPNGNPDTFWSDHWSCRFETSNGSFGAKHVAGLIDAADGAGFDVVKTEGLYTFDGERGYSLAQGE
jgi:isocitrate dehydrogenase